MPSVIVHCIASLLLEEQPRGFASLLVGMALIVLLGVTHAVLVLIAVSAALGGVGIAGLHLHRPGGTLAVAVGNIPPLCREIE
jgi:hypothetical protein